MAEEFLNKSTVAQLKEQCTQRKLETTGKKNDLVQRLIAFLDENPDDELAKTISGAEDENVEEEETNEEAEEDGGDGAEDEEPETEKKEEEANGEETGEKDEVKEEKEEQEKPDEKKTPAKSKPRPPGPRDFKRDSNVDMRHRSVVVGPVTPEDLKRDEIQEYAKKASCFFVRIHNDVEGEKHIGHVEYRFNSWEEAEKAAEEFPKLSDDCIVRRLAEKISAENVDREIRKTESAEREELDLRTISAYNIPVTTNEEQLKSVFTEVKSMLIARDDEGNFKGIVYLEYDTIEKTKEVYEKFKEGETKFDDQKVSFNRVATIPRIRKAAFKDDEPLSDERRDYLVQKRNELKGKLNAPGNMPMGRRRNFETQIFKIERRLDTDNEVRKKKGLPTKGPKLKSAATTPSGKRGGQQQSQKNRETTPRGRGAMRGGRGIPRLGSTPRGGGARLGSQNRGGRGGGFRNQQMSPGRGRGGGGSRFGRSGMGGNMGGSGGGGPVNQGPQGRLNPQATANAVNLLVGLSNMLNPNQMGGRQEGGDFNRGGSGGGGSGGNWNDSYGRNNQQSSNWNQGGGSSGNNYSSDGNYGGGNWNSSGNYDNMGGGSSRNYNDNYFDDPAAKRSRMSDYSSGSNMGNSSWNTGGGGYGNTSNLGGSNFSGGSSFGNTSDYSRFGAGTGSGSSNYSSFGSSNMGGGSNYGSTNYGGSNYGSKGGNYSSGGGGGGFRGGNNRKRSRSKSGGYY
jgi:hypothetical protein